MLSELLADTADPLAPKAPHFPGKAKRVIFLFMTGGVSHVDSFDPKPALAKAAADGKKGPRTCRSWDRRGVWKRYGKNGVEISELFPHIGGIVDDLCMIRSMTGDHNDHFQATMGVHTRLGDREAPEYRKLGQLRDGHGEPESAVICGPRAVPSVRRCAGLVVRLSAGRACGNAHHRRRRTGR